MDSYAIIGAVSILGACLCMGIGSIGSALGEGHAAATALQAMAQQPDEASRIRSTMFVSLAMIETTALYALLIAFLALYANPFWNYAISQ
ncbi:MAG: ATP synthase F0 subunit C [Alphaproteobacteria bacterium]|nr:ATP synthase F0 subunit C [Alphaproteobacteria bacterium]